MAEYNRLDLPAGETSLVTVHGRHDQPFTDRLSAPEEPGRFCYPPIAGVITAGARLLLALLERCVIDHGGTWAMAPHQTTKERLRDVLADLLPRIENNLAGFQ